MRASVPAKDTLAGRPEVAVTGRSSSRRIKRWIIVVMISIGGFSNAACTAGSAADDGALFQLLLLAALSQPLGGNPNRSSAVMTSGDPLIGEMWHLNNRGQAAFASGGATACEDINVADAIVSGLTGAGVITVVVDSGLEIAHEDLAQNIVPGGSFDFVGNDADPTNPAASGDHGTSVGGLIGARGFNGHRCARRGARRGSAGLEFHRGAGRRQPGTVARRVRRSNERRHL